MTKLCHALFKYENLKKLVEIIDLQLVSSLKLDGVWGKGTSWVGPRHIWVICIHKYSSPSRFLQITEDMINLLYVTFTWQVKVSR